MPVLFALIRGPCLRLEPRSCRGAVGAAQRSRGTHRARRILSRFHPRAAL